MKPILFYDETFPYPGQPLAAETLEQLNDAFRIVNANELAEALAGDEGECLVHLHGPYFPKSAWSAILSYLRQGKGLLHTGGAPFKIPVNDEEGSWKAEREQTAYHAQLLIHETLRVKRDPIASLAHNPDLPLFASHESLFGIEDTYGLILHVTRSDDHPDQLGSSGPMDAHIYPLLKGISKDGREVAAPAVLLEHTKGDYAGGRWVLINQKVNETFWRSGGAQALRSWATFAGRPVTEAWVKPNYASYEPGEKPVLSMQYQTIRRADSRSWRYALSVLREGAEVWSGEGDLKTSNDIGFLRTALPIAAEAGLYEVVCALTASDGERRTLRQGFWGMDRELLASGESLRCGRDYFVKNGKPMPIVGMTYMTSDVARKFLFLPNVSAWNRDMGQMEKAGINLIRTGIWTAWRNFAFVDGHTTEETLRAIDAFILTAARHGLELTFNFFSFTPEAWEGANPYLDPRSVEAQKRFIASVVSRHTESRNVQWDLINEPTMFDPKRLFQGPRSARDPFEKARFFAWLRQRHGTIEALQERWNMTPSELPDFESAVAPEPTDINFSVQDVGGMKRGLRWLDYCLFSMDMHNVWASELTASIKRIVPNQLVTVGQDEGLPSQRPTPFFYAEAVDYTTVHTWWEMDNLVWDGVFTKDPQKPNLVQETGIMYVETADGKAKRSEEELRNILERKYAYAFATGGAGAVQWVWNTNFYMNNVNESNIGALRADGTEKPEADVSYDFGAFMKQVGGLFEGRKLEEIAVVFPYSNDLGNRRLAYDATSRLVRLLAYDMKLPVRGIGEYQLDRLGDERVPLIIVPSAHNFRDEAMTQLLERITEKGGTLILTGPVSLDAYWGVNKRLANVLGETEVVNIRREELLDLDGRLYPVSFGGQRIADTNKEVPAGDTGAAKLVTIQVGRGTVVWCPLPIELNERKDVILAVYEQALAKAEISTELTWRQGGELPGVYGRKLAFDEGSLFVFVSELGSDADIEVGDPATGVSYAFKLERERSVLFFADAKGEITAVCRPDDVRVQTMHSQLT
ncbi:alpha-amylase family protein [Paenibacillus methanolicus]|uniref:Beta-galactosidase-like protein n=1 Tax=Paenibacillus methanolicus TaxID=582686 RepID=A0A5S5CIV8_9BACL|nr:alpha-amylase family protein [Paenibacillus methanolicus]TYP79736.1 beta-galactosidase-like protein [Paenibacillus methanolicus]